jgi:N-acetylneuraminate synthase
MVEIVAEFTTNHLGHLGLTLRMIEAAAQAGASAVKLQAKDVESFYTPEKLGGEYHSPYGLTYRDYRTMFEFDSADWVRIDDKCRACNIPWFVTIQDEPSLHQMLRYDLPRYKVASSNARNMAFLREVAAKVPERCEIVLSVGGSTLSEVGQALTLFTNHRRVWLLHCVAEYPCPPERLRLGNISELRRQFAGEFVHIGYSGHEQGIVPSLAAIDLGAEMVERHFCLSRHSFAHHIECSLKPDEFAELARLADNGTTWTLPGSALGSSFGMSDVEREFLEKQTYGNTYLGTASRM